VLFRSFALPRQENRRKNLNSSTVLVLFVVVAYT